MLHVVGKKSDVGWSVVMKDLEVIDIVDSSGIKRSIGVHIGNIDVKKDGTKKRALGDAADNSTDIRRLVINLDKLLSVSKVRLEEIDGLIRKIKRG